MEKFVGIKGIVSKDPYRIRGYDRNAFDYVIDIGANVGQVSLMAYILFPDAKLFAYEPCLDSYKVLCANMKGIPNLLLRNEAIGNGSDLYFKAGRGNSTSDANAFKEYNTGGYTIKSVTIDDVFKQNEIDLQKNILICMDCEGGEQYVLKDEYKHILLRCKQLSVEIHFQCRRKFKDLPKWSHYNDWIQNTFKETHTILYHYSSKVLGHGHYVIRRK